VEPARVTPVDDWCGAMSAADAHRARTRRLRYAEGQVRGLQRTVGEDARCIDVLTQVSAVTRALQSVALDLLVEHVEDTVGVARNSPEDGVARTAEATAAVARLVQS
jgi:DNA-binding FrmR family transcriptional regulator